MGNFLNFSSFLYFVCKKWIGFTIYLLFYCDSTFLHIFWAFKVFITKKVFKGDCPKGSVFARYFSPLYWLIKNCFDFYLCQTKCFICWWRIFTSSMPNLHLKYMYIIKCYSGEILYKKKAIKIKFLFVIKLIFIHCYFLFDHFIMFLLFTC